MVVSLSIIFFLFGLALGSFFNVVILRLIKEKSIMGRSHCPGCGTQLKWYDNIPLVSFLWLKTKCRHCHQPISWQYPLVELAAGLVWLVSWCVTQDVLLSLVFGVFGSWLLILFIFDLRWYVLPDIITLSGLAAAIVINMALGKPWYWVLGAAALGAIWFGLQYAVSKGKWVGSGDIRLGAMIGAMLASWQGLVVVLFGAYLLGTLVAVPLLALKKKGLKSELPFGTFLTLITFIVLLWGDKIWEWYMGVLW